MIFLWRDLPVADSCKMSCVSGFGPISPSRPQIFVMSHSHQLVSSCHEYCDVLPGHFIPCGHKVCLALMRWRSGWIQVQYLPVCPFDTHVWRCFSCSRDDGLNVSVTNRHHAPCMNTSELYSGTFGRASQPRTHVRRPDRTSQAHPCTDKSFGSECEHAVLRRARR